MDWSKQTAQSYHFWHVTTSSAIESIQRHGLRQSEEGQTGKGLYATLTDADVLESVIELLLQINPKEDLVLVEFTYSGTYHMNPVDAFIYANEGWVRIPSAIPPSNILTLTPISQLMY